MVELMRKRYGGDAVDGAIRLVSGDISVGLVTIDAVAEHPLDTASRSLINAESDLYFSVPESDVIIKRVVLPDEKYLDPRKLAVFEFSAMLLDDPDRYYIEVHDLIGGKEKLVVGYHQNCIDQQVSFFSERLIKPAGFKLRSLALADGYRYFCNPEGGELICLVDITANRASYCFLRDNRPALLGSLRGRKVESGGESNYHGKFIIDLAATLQFQASALFKSGHSVPLSRILVSGNPVSEELLTQIEQRLNVSTGFPSPKTALFRSAVVPEAGRYLVSLGLTVDH
ncbi:MAG: hypothetical protein JSV44_06160 [Candidatus Zixiibacteriota bacterium]|nr:MAG: hypothetical protein JSV44_06160 [candidate division Zixibacteria bacterium]